MRAFERFAPQLSERQMVEIEELFGPNSLFSQSITGFSPRREQQEMAQAVQEALDTYETLICEAGTGTGKTFAYLVPALLSGKRVVISTGTRNLQDQLFHRDLPLVRKVLATPAKVTLLKGRTNYLCLHRLDCSEGSRSHPVTRTRPTDLTLVREWAKHTRTGDIAECADIAEDSPIWPVLTSTTDNCLGQHCPAYDECFVLRARKAAIEADLIVVNHHLFFADMALREEGFGELLPGVDAVIFDEAHQLPDIATRFFGTRISTGQLVDLANDVLGAYELEAGDTPELRDAALALDKVARDLRIAFDDGLQRVSWLQAARNRAACQATHALAETLVELGAILEALSERGRSLANCHGRCRGLTERLSACTDELGVDPSAEEQVQWCELGRHSVAFHASPLEVSHILQSRMSAHRCAWIFTSATLAVGGAFHYFAQRLGLNEHRTARWQSPFDFAQQALMFVPDGLPDPRERTHTAAVVTVSAQILEASRGRAFLLFTSHRALDEAAGELRKVTDFPVMVQGTSPRNELLRRFRSTPNAVLLGTNSFWEGVDVRGNALSCVIIDKLPFAAPGDPILQARFAALRRRGSNPFVRYQLSHAVLTLKQGVGRLLRDVADRGVLVVCDPRLYSRPYGSVFLESLPPMPRTRRIEDVRRFFARADDSNRARVEVADPWLDQSGTLR